MSHISETRKGKKNTAEHGTERERESESDFFEGLSGRVESEKRKGQEERGRMRRCQICLSP